MDQRMRGSTPIDLTENEPDLEAAPHTLHPPVEAITASVMFEGSPSAMKSVLVTMSANLASAKKLDKKLKQTPKKTGNIDQAVGNTTLHAMIRDKDQHSQDLNAQHARHKET